ncbi:MAG: class I SAM-dependent methyltransferase [Kofleriaceae bacterium]
MASVGMVDPDSLERLVPDHVHQGITAADSLRLHLERYEFAARHARPGRLLDLACGVGYGTRLVFDRGTGVERALGVDLSAEAVGYARDRYAKPGIEFQTGNGLEFEDRDGFDTVVSLETVEHVPEPGRLLDRLAALVRPGGVLIASVPTTPTAFVNPHHLHDFTERSFRALVERPGFREVTHLTQRQPFSPLAILRREEPRMRDLRRNLAGYYLTHPRAAFERVVSTLRYGFANRYTTIAWRRG